MNASEIFKPSIFIQEGQFDLIRRSISLFPNDQFGLSSVFFRFIVNLIPVKEKNDVGILFDGSRFPKI